MSYYYIEMLIVNLILEYNHKNRLTLEIIGLGMWRGSLALVRAHCRRELKRRFARYTSCYKDKTRKYLS